MRAIDRYHKWVEWSDEDQIHIGKCPDVITGIHGDDPVQVYRELCEVINDVLEHLEKSGRSLPPSKTRPMVEVA
jgi:predicted RNase H-like HicB family nuclease